tara:strand:+ start:1129 stop:1542 length:414 start_codon:yes stop_codon:yes gene_type:complete
MDKFEKFIYSVKNLPQALYFGSAGLLILVIFLNVNLIEIIIPLFLFFIYMTYLASKNYKSGGTDPLEKLIYSKKYLPSILYFGTLGIVIFDIYCNDFTEFEFVPPILETPLFFWFLYITYLGCKNLMKNNNFTSNKE